MPGIRLPCNSTTVISAPKALYTVAISRPIMPPPITKSFLGISAKSKASVESIMRGSSFGKTGILVTREPAAITQLSKLIVLTPSDVSTSSVWLPVKLASPCNISTLRFLARAVKPPVNLSTMLFFHVSTLRMSIWGLVKLIPCSDISAASLMTLAVCNSALDGIQPTLRHTPPIRAWRSIIITF